MDGYHAFASSQSNNPSGCATQAMIPFSRDKMTTKLRNISTNGTHNPTGVKRKGSMPKGIFGGKRQADGFDLYGQNNIDGSLPGASPAR